MGPGSGSHYLLRLIKLAAEKYKINLKQPFADLPKEHAGPAALRPARGEGGRTGFHGIFALPARRTWKRPNAKATANT